MVAQVLLPLPASTSAMLVLLLSALTFSCLIVCTGWDEILEGGLAEGATVMSWRVSEGHAF